MQPVIEAGSGGLEIRDPIERRRVALGTGRSVSPTDVDPGTLRVPVGAAVRVTLREVVLDRVVDLFVRDTTGEVVADAASSPAQMLPEAEYVLEVNAPVKVYLTVESALELTAGPDGIRVRLPAPTTAIVGARSYHHQPSGTITTTTDPADLRTAVSALASALKTTGPERSYPTLRGHPPLVELGPTLSVPDGLEPPETGVRLELPSTLEALLPAAPLAYYLGADIVEGEEPRLVTDAGLEYDLAREGGFEPTVRRVLERTFFLDCLVRTEGYAGIDLHERSAVESTVDLDFERLYDESLAERLSTYLDVPHDAVADKVPRWSLTACVPPEPDSVEVLPFVVDDLAAVQVRTPEQVPVSDLRELVVTDYLAAGDGFPLTRRSDSEDGPAESVVALPKADAVEQVWFGDGTPWNASKGILAAYRNGLGREPNDGPIDITVVGNEAGMDEEPNVAAAAYRDRAGLPFDVTIETNLSRAELREVLQTETDFLHYVGHIEPDGFRCRDGVLDVEDLETVGVDAFLLNGCRSYEQGVALVERGAIGGVVTVSDVINSGAVEVGRTVARLLNRGFPLRAALALARVGHVLSGHYLIVGDGTIDVAQSENGAPMVCELERPDDGTFELTASTFLPSEGGMGTVAFPFLPSNDSHYLAPGSHEPVQLSEEKVTQFFERFATPLIIDGELVIENVHDRLDVHGP